MGNGLLFRERSSGDSNRIRVLLPRPATPSAPRRSFRSLGVRTTWKVDLNFLLFAHVVCERQLWVDSGQTVDLSQWQHWPYVCSTSDRQLSASSRGEDAAKRKLWQILELRISACLRRAGAGGIHMGAGFGVQPPPAHAFRRTAAHVFDLLAVRMPANTGDAAIRGIWPFQALGRGTVQIGPGDHMPFLIGSKAGRSGYGSQGGQRHESGATPLVAVRANDDPLHPSGPSARSFGTTRASQARCPQ